MPDQTDLFWKGQSGAALRDRALRKFEKHEPRWLERARARMVELYGTSRCDLSSDDVWRLCPPPVSAHPSVMGAVFKSGLFIQTGWKASTRRSAHARVIRTYIVRGED